MKLVEKMAQRYAFKHHKELPYLAYLAGMEACASLIENRILTRKGYNLKSRSVSRETAEAVNDMLMELEGDLDEMLEGCPDWAVLKEETTDETR